MKKTGLEIVEMIAKGEAPKKILAIDFAERFEWDKERVDYYDITDTRLLILNNLDTEFEIIEENKVWKPKVDEEYHYISDDGNIITMKWKNTIIDRLRYELGNCYKTFEEAQKVLEKIKIYVRLKRYAEEHNTEKIDFYKDNLKFYIFFDGYSEEITIGCIDYNKYIGQVYFTSEDIAEQAIQEIGEDNIKKLFEEEQ